MTQETVESIQHRDIKRLEAMACNLTRVEEVKLIQRIIKKSCSSSPVTNEWLEQEMMDLRGAKV
ncbi:hypothetical protein [Planococcus halotolerans]|uniref:Uncharacterized protein n=1 Tax=Planococcus halotolerans TaxID=2233542 RepID=A0A365KKD5_9BACL|nr:hypothetical protein [Planococcus halotolerans]RAZ73605.1 hypothetical protein DP120_16845 [Planococcus halotolerans]